VKDDMSNLYKEGAGLPWFMWWTGRYV